MVEWLMGWWYSWVGGGWDMPSATAVDDQIDEELRMVLIRYGRSHHPHEVEKALSYLRPAFNSDHPWVQAAAINHSLLISRHHRYEFVRRVRRLSRSPYVFVRVAAESWINVTKSAM